MGSKSGGAKNFKLKIFFQFAMFLPRAEGLFQVCFFEIEDKMARIKRKRTWKILHKSAILNKMSLIPLILILYGLYEYFFETKSLKNNF